MAMEARRKSKNLINRLYQEDDYKREAFIEKDSVEPEEYRSDFRRDYARLIHSSSFRRLQGKTQLFPGVESDFFRNRLTHSLEVAQIAKSIAIRFNAQSDQNGEYDIDTDLVEFAALAHDLGHPPFGHTGEDALAECMRDNGGFEGNAQTLRILAKLEKRAVAHERYRKHNGVHNHIDQRKGLNLTYRSLASVIKYDEPLADSMSRRARNSIRKGRAKGYYDEEDQLVERIRNQVAPDSKKGQLKAIECSIMDIADDIAYASSDLEDALKAGFLTPMDMLAVGEEIRELIANEISISFDEHFSANEVQEALDSLFAEFILDKDRWIGLEYEPLTQPTLKQEDLRNRDGEKLFIRNAALAYTKSKKLEGNSYFRTRLISSLIGLFIRGTHFSKCEKHPSLSKAHVDKDVRVRIEVLKHFTYHSQVMSPRLKVIEYRGKDIIYKLFDTLSSPDGSRLLPVDFRNLFHSFQGKDQYRLVCDFIAGMTDRYAFEYYARITTEQAQTIFKPL